MDNHTPTKTVSMRIFIYLFNPPPLQSCPTVRFVTSNTSSCGTILAWRQKLGGRLLLLFFYYLISFLFVHHKSLLTPYSRSLLAGRSVGLFCFHSLCVSVVGNLGFGRWLPSSLKTKTNVLPLISVCIVCKVYIFHCCHTDGDFLIMCLSEAQGCIMSMADWDFSKPPTSSRCR